MQGSPEGALGNGGVNSSMVGYGTLGEGTGIMSFMQVGNSNGNALPRGGLDPKSPGLL